jgi:translation initiation factor IF-2
LIEVVKNEKEAQQKIALIQEEVDKQKDETAIQQFMTGLQEDETNAELRIILKSDGPSSLDAARHSIDGIIMPKKVSIKIVHSDAGHFSDSDLSLAQASKAILI